MQREVGHPHALSGEIRKQLGGEMQAGRRRRHGQRCAGELLCRQDLAGAADGGTPVATGDGHEVLVEERLAGDATVLGQQDADGQIDIPSLERRAHARGIDRHVGHLAQR